MSINDQDLNVLKLYLDEISQIPLLDLNEEKRLFILFNNGSLEASKKIAKSNLRLVVSIARKYVNRGIPFEDLIQEGNVGLMEAIYGYDLTKNVKFSTYATIIITKYIKKAIISYNMIHHNPKIYYKIERLQLLYKELWLKLERKPSIEELAKYSNIKEDYIKELLSYCYQVDSIYNPIKSDSEEVLLDFINDDSNLVEDIVIEREFKEFINYIVFKSNILDEQEQFIIINRFGFYNKVMSYNELGEKYNISGEAIRQKIVKAIIRILKIYGDKLSAFSNNSSESEIVINNAQKGKFKLHSFKAKNRKENLISD